MRVLALLSAIFFLVLAASSTWAQEQPTQETKPASPCSENFSYLSSLQRAENAYVRRHYNDVITLLTPLQSQLDCIDDADARLEINLLLGVANLEDDDEEAADAFFLAVLRSDPTHEIGSIITLPESSIKRLENLRLQHAVELNQLREEKEPGIVIESLYVLSEKQHHPYWINFLPMGAGLYQMDQGIWAILYASTQLSGLSLSILGAGMVEYYRSDNYSYTPSNWAKAKNWQYAQIAGIAIFGASYIASVIHALIVHEPTTTLIHPPTRSQPASLQAAAPWILPDGAGLLYETRF